MAGETILCFAARPVPAGVPVGGFRHPIMASGGRRVHARWFLEIRLHYLKHRIFGQSCRVGLLLILKIAVNSFHKNSNVRTDRTTIARNRRKKVWQAAGSMALSTSSVKKWQDQIYEPPDSRKSFAASIAVASTICKNSFTSEM
jgi:hypothetical protein